MESTGILIQSIQRVTKNRSLQQKKTDVLMPVFLILRSRDMDSTKEMSFISYRKKTQLPARLRMAEVHGMQKQVDISLITLL